MKNIPKFKNEKEEREFWQTHDSTDYLDWSKAKLASFPNLKPTRKSISIRLPVEILVGYKALANKKDVHYQSLIKMALAEHLERETAKRPTRRKGIRSHTTAL